MDERLLKARKRLRDDFTVYAPAAIKIRNKKGDIVPFRLNPAQQKLHTKIEDQKQRTGKVRLLILKARQQGFSSYVGARMYFGVSQRKGAKALVLAHKQDSSANLFGMVKRTHENCPEALRPSTRYSNKKELVFDSLDSTYRVDTAGGDAVSRGDTLTHCHCSEVGFWPKGSAANIWNGLSDCIPPEDGTEVYLESTANGCSGLFWDLWQQALKGNGEYEAFFSPWFDTPEYRAKAPEDFEPSPGEKDIIAKYGLDYDQLQWRRNKIAEKKGDLDLFRQEYPANPEEAWLTSGRPVFHAETVSKLLTETVNKWKGKRLPTYALTPGNEWELDPRGELVCYERPDPTKVYSIGADVSKGIRGCDYSVAQVIDDKHRLVARWRGYLYPDAFADVLYELGMWYNCALLVVETMDHGILTGYRLVKELNYPHVFHSTRYDANTDRETDVVGFVTNARTKPLVIDRLRSAILHGTIEIGDEETLRELSTYIVSDSGKLEAEAGCFDDCVMALAFALHGAYELPAPIPMNDSWYRETF